VSQSFWISSGVFGWPTVDIGAPSLASRWSRSNRQ
jgi:hypothetical protein